ncbi:MAG TPA: ABC transporter permease [Gemmatimonadales bacterium]|nr:ABC transporter permease [Gemmatimonadales bacterium]
MASLTQDLRYAVRTLRKSPAFTTVAVLTLGLGIGANTAIFSVINAVLLRPLPFRDPERLVTVEHHYPSLNDLHASVSVPGFLTYESKKQIFEHAGVETGWAPTLTGQGDAERLQASQVSADWFKTLGVTPGLGRAFLAEDATAGHEHVVVLSEPFWRARLGGDPKMVGKSILLNGEQYQVIGVMPPGFRGALNRQAQLWAPYVPPPALVSGSPTNEFLTFTGRLAAGVTPEQAQRELDQLAKQLKADNPSSYSPDWGLLLTTLTDRVTGSLRRALLVLLGAVGLVLLIACANVANLQLARAASRSREVAVRVAMGASPAALVRQLLTESVLLALMGGVLAVLLAAWGVPALLALNASNLPPASDIGLDPTVLLFTLLISVVTGLVFGLAPALRVRHANLHETLKEGGRGAAGDLGGLALRRGLVVATVALALTLLVGAGLMVRSFARLVGVDPGFDPDNLLTFNLALPATRYSNDTLRMAAFDRVNEALVGLPGVVGVGGTTTLPFGGSWATGSFNVEGYQAPANTPGPWGDQRLVTTNFLPTLGVRLLKGRQFTDQDGPGAPGVVIVDEEMVQRYWPHDDPIGKRITFNSLTDSSITWITVVGVVNHTMHEGLDGGRRVQLYYPLRQAPRPFVAFAVRTRGAPMGLAPQVKAAIKAFDPDLAVSNLTPMSELIETSTGPRRFSMVLLGIFSGLAAVLATIGLYGVMSFTVTQRSKELGVRLALGAVPQDVLRLVLTQGMRLVLFGVGIGLVAALVLSRVLRTLLFNVSATDPLTFVLISFLLLVVTLLATWLPARRATRVDPVTVLRDE